jgi:Pyruvate/2-oxoacid:ferredoxin oxidoreductase gamma subunit
VNTAILGAFAGFLGWVNLESVCRAIRDDIPRADANVAAAREAAGRLRVAAAHAEVGRV